MEATLRRLNLTSSQAAIIGAIAGSAALGYAAHSYFFSTNSSDLLPALDEKETLHIMTAILNKMKVAANNMLGAHANIKKQIYEQGHQMSDKDIMVNYILPHFETAIQELQNAVLADADVEECEIAEAVNHYSAENFEIGEVVYKIKHLYKEFGGDIEIDETVNQSAVEDADEFDLSSDDLIALLKRLSAKMSLLVDAFADEFLDQYGVPSSNEEKTNFQLGMMQISEDAQRTILEEYKTTEAGLQKALMENQQNEELQMVFVRMQMETQNILAQKGIALMP